MITPIGARGSPTRKHADWVYKYVGEACEPRNIVLERADIMAGSPMITSRIFEAVRGAELCVADLSGLNANVFYELGVRHSLGLPVVHIALEGTVLPFDNAQHDTIPFDLTSSESMDQLAEQVGRQFDEIRTPGYVVSNPFTAALGAIQIQQSGDPRDQVLARLEERLQNLERDRMPSLEALAHGADPADSLLRVAQQYSRPLGPARSSIALEWDFVERAMTSIPPWDTEKPQLLYDALSEAKGILNREKVMDLLRSRFDSIIPF